MVSVIVAVVAGSLGALLADSVSSPPAVAVAAAIAGFVLAIAAFGYWGQRRILRFTKSIVRSSTGI